MYLFFLFIAWCIMIFSGFNAAVLTSLNMVMEINGTITNYTNHCPMNLDNWKSAISSLDVIVLIGECLVLAGYICNGNLERRVHCCIFVVWDTLICFIGGHLAMFGGCISLFIYSTMGYAMSKMCRYRTEQVDLMFTSVTILLITIPLWILTYMVMAVMATKSSMRRRAAYRSIEEEN